MGLQRRRDQGGRQQRGGQDERGHGHAVAYWDGLRGFYKKNEGYLQGQIGNPDGADKPNKKFYDPRVWIRAAEESMIKRAHESFKCLNGANVCGDDWPKSS